MHSSLNRGVINHHYYRVLRRSSHVVPHHYWSSAVSASYVPITGIMNRSYMGGTGGVDYRQFLINGSNEPIPVIPEVLDAQPIFNKTSSAHQRCCGQTNRRNRPSARQTHPWRFARYYANPANQKEESDGNSPMGAMVVNGAGNRPGRANSVIGPGTTGDRSRWMQNCERTRIHPHWYKSSPPVAVEALQERSTCRSATQMQKWNEWYEYRFDKFSIFVP